MENGLLPNSAITASSVYGASTHRSWEARLNNAPKGNSGAWSAASNKAGQWLQIDLGEERLLTNFATQGRPSSPQWVTSYTILFSSDSVTWTEYSKNGVVKVCDAFFFQEESHTQLDTWHCQFLMIFQGPREVTCLFVLLMQCFWVLLCYIIII